MWLAHRGGFTAVIREGDADAGRAKVRVIQTGEVLTVDEDDLEKVGFTGVLSETLKCSKQVTCVWVTVAGSQPSSGRVTLKPADHAS